MANLGQMLLEVRDFLQDISTGAPITDSSRDHATEFVALMDEAFSKVFEGETALRSPAVNVWQPITDYVPDHNNSNVLVATDSFVSEAYYNGETDSWWETNTSEHDFDAASPIYPTHWQPLPEPPALTAKRPPMQEDGK